MHALAARSRVVRGLFMSISSFIGRTNEEFLANMSHPIMLLEFNELSPSLLKRFIGEGLLPNFKKLYAESSIYVTDAGEAQDNLEPWIQWVTVHTGLSFEEHGVFLLGDGPKCDKPRLWDILSSKGKTNWICGSMNTGYTPDLKGFLLPDPWTVGAKAYPEGEFDPFVKFVSVQVQEHTNQRTPLGYRDYIKFLKWMLQHGLSLSTVAFVVKQLAVERLTGKFRWRRAVVLDLLQWDVFTWYFARNKPDFSTFFINSTAHFQHLHWRNMDPELFQVKPGKDEQKEYENAVLYGYQRMDAIVGKAIDLAGDTHTVVFSSALGQQPCLKYEEQGGKVFYRPRDFREFTVWAGLDMQHEVQPVMSEEFRIVFRSESDAMAAESQLKTVTVGGAAGLHVRREGAGLMVGCRIFRKLEDAPLMEASGRPARAFFDIFYAAEGLKSGMHHSEGCLWIRDPRRERGYGERHAPLKAVAPTLLAMQGIDPREWMDGPILGAASSGAGHRRTI